MGVTIKSDDIQTAGLIIRLEYITKRNYGVLIVKYHLIHS
jgi:hypothetical protein